MFDVVSLRVSVFGLRTLASRAAGVIKGRKYVHFPTLYHGRFSAFLEFAGQLIP